MGDCNYTKERCWWPRSADYWIILKVELLGFADGLYVGYKREGGIKDSARVSGLSYWKNEVAIK